MEQGRYAGILHFVVDTVDDQRRAGDNAQFGDDGPVLQRPRHDELVNSEPAKMSSGGQGESNSANQKLCSAYIAL
jgi:hypothetical protein